MDDETANTTVGVSSGLSYAGGRPSPVTVTAALGPEPELLPVKKETPTYTARPVSTRTRLSGVYSLPAADLRVRWLWRRAYI